LPVVPKGSFFSILPHCADVAGGSAENLGKLARQIRRAAAETLAAGRFPGELCAQFPAGLTGGNRRGPHFTPHRES
jgi:hypothetical protein